jgi:PKHD-type hydroxylase
MFREIELLTPGQVAELKRIAAAANFVDGRISNPHSQVKQNLHLNDDAAFQKSSQMLTQALMEHEDFRNFAFPVAITPPLMTRYTKGMRYGVHPDAAFIRLPTAAIRSDLSCTIFLDDPASYEGGALRIHLGTRDLRFKGAAGTAIIYPSNQLHEVEEVTSGERLVAIAFIQSQVFETYHRELLYELNEVAALEGLKMSFENFSRLQLIQQNLLRLWSG